MKHLVDVGISDKIATFVENACTYKKPELVGRHTPLSLALSALGRIAVNSDLRDRILKQHPQVRHRRLQLTWSDW